LGAAIESGQAAIEHLRRAHDPWTLVDALAWTAFPLAYGGAPREARLLAEEGAEIGMKVGHIGGEVLARRGVALAALLERADLDENERAACDDLERLESIRSPWVSMSYAWVATIRTRRGDVDGSLPFAEEAINLEPDSAWAGLGWSAKFVNRAWAGELAVCRDLLAEQRARLPRAGEAATSGRTFMLYAAAEGCVIAGLADEAGALHPLLAERVDVMPIGDAFAMALAQRIAGMAAAAAGLWDDAQAHFEEAGRQARDVPNRIDAPQVQLWHAKMLLDRGDAQDRDRARAMLADALDSFRKIGMPLLAARTEELLG
jgi:tetratricopeptide (TPR) repeat protein